MNFSEAQRELKQLGLEFQADGLPGMEMCSVMADAAGEPEGVACLQYAQMEKWAGERLAEMGLATAVWLDDPDNDDPVDLRLTAKGRELTGALGISPETIDYIRAARFW